MFTVVFLFSFVAITTTCFREIFSSTLFRPYINPVSLDSLYLAVDHLKATTAKPVIRKLKAYIAKYGIPDEIVSSEFQQFSKDYGFKHTGTSPHHHQANGKTESAVKQAKKIMRKAKTSGNDPQMAFLDVGNTPMEGYGVSPAQLLMSRRTKTKLPTSENHLKPRVVENIADKFRRGKTTSVNSTTGTQKRLIHYRRRT